MKINFKIFMFALLLVFAVANYGCNTTATTTTSSRSSKSVVKAKRIPPGQAKKMSGDKSARRHAPGHNK